MKRLIPLLLVLFAPLALSSQGPEIDLARDWPWWRGPTRDNKTAPAPGQDAPRPPVHFSDHQNVVWKAAVPGRGHASPVAVGPRIFLATAFQDRESQAVLAFDRDTGASLWEREVNRGGLPEKIHSKNTHASSTVASDGERVFAVFYNRASLQVAALSVEGEPLWERRLAPFKHERYEFGYAASPLLIGRAVVVAGDQDKGSFLTALDCETGEILWTTDRPEIINYASPTLASIGGLDQILLGGSERVAAYAPDTGRLLWEAPGAAPPQTAGTVVWDGDLVFASGGYPDKLTSAVRAGSGELVWQNQKQCYEQSMLAHDGHLYAITDNGIAYCWRASDGEEKWAERLRGPISASPVLMRDRELVCAANERGTFYVFRADPERFELVAENQLGDEAFATPAIAGGRVYIRVAQTDEAGDRREFLYCFGE